MESRSSSGVRWRFAAALAGAAWVLTQAWRLRQAVEQGRCAARQTTAFSTCPRRSRARVLLLGDSTGVGVGARCPQDSLAGLLAHEFPDVEVVNRSASGARLADALQQAVALADAGESFDLALLLVGGNDVLAGTPQSRLKNQAGQLLRRLRGVARHTAWLGCADIGALPLFLPPLSWCLSWHTRRTMRLLSDEARNVQGAVFVDFARRSGQNPFGQRPDVYLAADGVHPSTASYRHCFDILKRQVPLAALLPAAADAGGLPVAANDGSLSDARTTPAAPRSSASSATAATTVPEPHRHAGPGVRASTS